MVNMGSTIVFVCSIRSDWKNSQPDIASRVSEPVCHLMNGKIQDIMYASESMSSQNMSSAKNINLFVMPQLQQTK